MSTLLLKISGSKTFNKTIFAPYIFIYDDILLYRKRKLFSVTEITVAYSHIAEVNLKRGVFFAALEINTTAQKTIIVRYLNKGLASHAKKIIDQKIHFAHAKHKPESEVTAHQNQVSEMEKSLNRLNELYNKGKISEKEFNSSRKQLLERID